MKRDMDTVRAILRVIEERPATSSNVSVVLEGADKQVVAEHLRIMQDAGLVEGVSVTSSGAACLRLTWQGHEFLESTRKDTLWSKAKDIALKKTGGLSMVAITEAIKEAVKMAIG